MGIKSKSYFGEEKATNLLGWLLVSLGRLLGLLLPLLLVILTIAVTVAVGGGIGRIRKGCRRRNTIILNGRKSWHT